MSGEERENPDRGGGRGQTMGSRASARYLDMISLFLLLLLIASSSPNSSLYAASLEEVY